MTKTARKKLNKELGFDTEDDTLVTMMGWKLVLDIEEWLAERECSNDPA